MTSKPLTFMNESILLEALKEIADSKREWKSEWELEQLAIEAIKKWEDSSGKETGMEQIVYVPLDLGDYERDESEIDKGWVNSVNGWIKPVKLADLFDELYDQIKHGDEEHQKWLKEKIESFKNGIKLSSPQSVPPYKEEVDKEDELWNEVMQEMGFYSSQLDNIKSKFHLTRKI